MKAYLGTGWRHIRQRGLVPALRSFGNRYYRSQQLLVVRGPLAGPSAVDHVGDVVLRLATDSDLQQLDELESYGRGSIQRRYVEEQNDWLFVACRQQRIVATERASRVIRDPLVSRVIRLSGDQVWSADAFCLPEYRSQRISRYLGIFGQRFLAGQGYREFLGGIKVGNTPALRMALHAGATVAYHVSYMRVISWERVHVSNQARRHAQEAS